MGENSDLPLLVIVTGLSGAGKSTVIHALEDLSFYCMENIPFDLVEQAVDHLISSSWQPKRFAIGMDPRDQRFVQELPEFAKKLRSRVRLDVIFLTSSDEILAERFSTTRRKHPLLDSGGELLAAIRREISLMAPLETFADVSLDTSEWSPHYLARKIEDRYSSDRVHRQLHVTITSFGFKHGMLKPADSIYDVRFLRNPHFDPQLKNRTGLEKPVSDYVFEDPATGVFLSKLLDLNAFLFPNYYAEGKHYFRIGIGCTGGKHRSVAISERLALELAALKIPNVVISVNHRDINIGLAG